MQFTTYDNTLTRKLAERITVLNEDTIMIKIRDTDKETEVRLRPRK